MQDILQQAYYCFIQSKIHGDSVLGVDPRGLLAELVLHQSVNGALLPLPAEGVSVGQQHGALPLLQAVLPVTFEHASGLTGGELAPTFKDSLIDRLCWLMSEVP